MNQSSSLILSSIDDIIVEELKTTDPNFEFYHNSLKELFNNKFFMLLFNPLILFLFLILSISGFLFNLETLKLFLSCALLSFSVLNFRNFINFYQFKKKVVFCFSQIADRQITEEAKIQLTALNVKFNNPNITYADLNQLKIQIIMERKQK